MNRETNGAFSMIADYEGDITQLFEGSKDGLYPILATRNLVLFPGIVSPVLVGRSTSLNMISSLKNRENATFAVFCQKDANVDTPRSGDLFEYGVFAKIIRVLEMPGPDNNVTVIMQGLGRCHLDELVKTTPYLKGWVSNVPETFPTNEDKEFFTAIDDLKSSAIDYVKKNEDIPDEAQFALQNISNPVVLANFVCTSLPFDNNEKISLLKQNSLKERVFTMLRIVYREIQLLELKQDIRTKTREDLDEQQREYFLQQQIKNIKEELSGGNGNLEKKELEEQAMNKIWPEDIAATFHKELDKLDTLNPQGPEYSVQLGHIHHRRPQPAKGRTHSQPRPLWHDKGEGTYSGTDCRAQSAWRHEIAHHLPVWPSRCGQDQPWQKHCPFHEAQLCQDITGRCARRG